MSIDALLQFIMANKLYCLIIAAIGLIIGLFFIFAISFIFKKKPVEVIDTIVGKIFALLPVFILNAEDKYGKGHGVEKKSYVLSLVQEWFDSEHLEFTDYYYKLVRMHVEQILKTPQSHDKKED